MNPQEVQQPTAVDNVGGDVQPKKSKKKLKIAVAALATVLVLGGVTAGLVVRSIYNKPENVVATALGNYLLDGKSKSFGTQISFTPSDPAAAASTVKVDGNVQMAGKSTQIDFTANISVLTVRGAIQANENGSLYVKVEELPSLVASGVLQAYGITDEMATQIASLDNKWIEIKPDDMASLTGKKAGEGPVDKCTSAIYAALDNESLGDAVDKLYKKNRFIQAKSSSEDIVDGKKLLKVELGLDQAKLDVFGKEVVKSDAINKLADDCGLKGDGSKSNVSDSASNIRDGKVTVWVDRGKKQLVKLEASADNYQDGKKDMEMKMVMSAKKPADKLETPKDAVDVMTLLQKFGIDSTMLQSLGATPGA